MGGQTGEVWRGGVGESSSLDVVGLRSPPTHHPHLGGCSTDLLVRIDWPSAVGPYRLDVASRSAPLPIVWFDWVSFRMRIVTSTQVMTSAMIVYEQEG